jgi:hypothetical protein
MYRTAIRKSARIADTVGAIAQLGERLHGMQEVSGSIPLGSTKSLRTSFDLQTPACRGLLFDPVAGAVRDGGGFG